MDINSLIEGIEKLLDYMFGGNTPVWLLPTISWIVGVGLILAGLVFLLGLIKKMWTEFIQPAFYNQEDIRQRFRRHMFADHVESELRYINALESWNDNRFTELETHIEIEAEGAQQIFGIFSGRIPSRSGIRLERSLSNAIERSSERLVLLEGDPGSGKSVALRHVAQLMSIKAHKSKNLKARIPIYINLKYLHRGKEESIDRNMIERFVFKTINRVNDRDIDNYLHDEFRRGMEQGTWLFLFDSFDEIPEILSSTGADNVIRIYAESIRDFLHGMNNCRGILASREYKGPRFLGWPRFRILSLRASGRIDLVKRTGLPLKVQKKIIEGLAVAVEDFRVMANNPLFLNLVCDFMSKPSVAEFPSNIHVVFEEYIRRRLARDEERLQQRFNKSPQEIKEAAERLAYCMTADQGLGLSPTLSSLFESTEKMGFGLGANFDSFTEALVYLKLARIDASFIDGTKTFTFAHRRFQEYFATAIVLRHPETVSNYELLTNGRWRETAVVILQTQNKERNKSLINSACDILEKLGGAYRDDYRILSGKGDLKIEVPKFRFWSLAKHLFEPFPVSRQLIQKYIRGATAYYENRWGSKKFNTPLFWPQGLYHLIAILQDGLQGKSYQLPENMQVLLDEILMDLFERGDILDETWCLELAGITSEKYMTVFIERGISLGSRTTKRISFLQVSKLSIIPAKIKEFIEQTLFEMAVTNKLTDERHEVSSHLTRLPNSRKYLRYLAFLIWMPTLDLIFMLLGLVLITPLMKPNQIILNLVVVLFLWLSTWRLGSELWSTLIRLEVWFFWMIWAAYFFYFPVSSLFQSENIRVLFFVALTSFGLVSIFPTLTSVNRLFQSLGLILFAIVGFLSLEVYFQFGLNAIKLLIPYRIYFAIFFILDLVYLFTRLKIIYQEIPKKYRGKKLFAILGFNSDLFPLLLWLEFMVFAEIPLFIMPRNVVFYLYFAIIYILFMNEQITGVYYFLQGIVKYIAWARKASPMNFLSFLKQLDLNKSGTFRAMMIRYVITKNLIMPDAGTNQHLRNLISFVSARVSYPDDDQNEKLRVIDSELQIALHNDYWNIDQLDELMKLQNQIQSFGNN